MPTVLPPSRRVKKKRKLSVFSVLFNTFLVVSALALTFAVLVREEEYALAQTDDGQTIETGARTASSVDTNGMIQPE